MSQLIPIWEAEELAATYKANRVVIWAFAPGTGQIVTTWGGPSIRDSHLAAEAGNAIKQMAGWPSAEATAVPKSFVKLFEDFDAEVAKCVATGELHKGTTLALMYAFRDVVRRKDPEIAELLLPVQTEAAVQPPSAAQEGVL